MKKIEPNPLALKSGDLLPFDKRISAGRSVYSIEEYKQFDPSEIVLQARCEDELKKRGFWYIHLPASAYKTAKIQAGIPDLLIFIPKDGYNIDLLVELKSKKGKMRQGQKRFSRHAVVYEVKTFPDFKDILDRFEKI